MRLPYPKGISMTGKIKTFVQEHEKTIAACIGACAGVIIMSKDPRPVSLLSPRTRTFDELMEDIFYPRPRRWF